MDIEPYQPGISDDQLRKQFGEQRLVKLNSNENLLGPSPLALLALENEIKKIHLYPDGSSEFLRAAIAAHHGLSIDQVFTGNGSDDIIKLLSETFLEEGDEIVVPFPSFSQYGFGAQVMRANIRSVPLGTDFSYDVEQMVGAIGPKTKLLYLCTPNNPTGTVLKQAEFDWLMERIPKDVLVIVDLAYDNYATDNDRFQVTEAALQYRNVCYLHTFSKLYGLAGLRVGYGLGHPDVWSYVHRVREPFNVNRLAQTGAIAALADVDHVQSSQALAAQSRAQYARLNEVGIHVVPSQANFTLIDVKDGVRVFEELKREGILVRAGYPGLKEYVRVTFGLPEDNERCIQGILQLVGS